MNEIKYLYGHETQETAYVVEDYPWGFRLRTTIRYWVEYKKGFGHRFTSQTINPKTGCWCAPKYGVYYMAIVMYLNEDGHVKYDGLSTYASVEKIEEFKKRMAA